MNITFVLREFPKTSETFIQSQVEGLIARGHRVRILSLRTPPQPVRRNIPAGLAGIRYAGITRNTLKTTARTIPSLVRVLLPSRLRKITKIRSFDDLMLLPHLASPLFTDADAVIVHFGDLACRYAEIAERFGIDVPFAGVFHGVDVARHLPSLREGHRDILWRGMAMGLPVSGFWRGRLIGLGCPPDKLTVHHMGIDPGLFRPREQPSGTGPFTLVTVCRLVEKKGIDTVLNALAECGPPDTFIYHIIGDGPERIRLESLARHLGLTGAVRFHGSLPPGSVAQHLAGADTFVLASRTASNGDMEGIPVSLMEAMACGLPVISTRHSGIPELVEDGVCGLLADEGDSDGIAAAIRRLMNDRSFGASLGTAARLKVIQSFNTTILAGELESILTEMILENPGDSR